MSTEKFKQLWDNTDRNITPIYPYTKFGAVTNDEGKTVDEVLSGVSGKFIVTPYETTFQEIYNAYNEGRQVVVEFESSEDILIAPLVAIADTICLFVLNVGAVLIGIQVTSDGEWEIVETAVSLEDHEHDLSEYATRSWVTSSLNGKLSTAGGNISGHIYLTGAKESSSTGNTSQIVFGTSSSNHVAISSNNNALVINPTSSSTSNQIVLYLDKASVFPNGISGNLTGTASKATADASGNNIVNTYAKKTELSTVKSEVMAYIDETILGGSW